MRTSMGQRLGWLLASFGVLAALALGGFAYTAARDMMQERAQNTLLRTARVLSVQLQTGFDSVGRDATVLAYLVASQLPQSAQQGVSLPAPTQQVLTDAFRAMLQARPAYTQIRYIALAQHGLEQVRLQRAPSGAIERTPDAQLQEKAHFPFVFETALLRSGAVYLSDFGTNHEDPQPPSDQALYSAAAPVFQGGAVVGVLVVRIDANTFLERISGGLPQPYGLYLTNRWGDYLVHPDRSKAFGFERGDRVLVQDEFAGTAPLLDGSGKEKIWVQTAPDGAALALAFVRVPYGSTEGGRFFLIGLSEPMDAVNADVRELGGDLGKMLAVLALAALVLAAWVSRIVTSPLRQLTRAAEAFSKGRAHGALPVMRQDELGDLARGFSDMEEQIQRQMYELNSSRDAMAHLAHHDPLTGLANRRLFEQNLEQALERAQRSGRALALVFVDLDQFKSINDQLGHTTGDAVLQAAAQAIQGAVRQVDKVARLAGDEFTVLCENVDNEEGALQVLDKLHQAFEQPLLVQGHPMRIRASMGVSLFPRDGDNARILLASADAAMYRAKGLRSTW